MVGAGGAGPGLIGRGAELTRVRAAVRSGHAVLVSGAPGVGKTALVAAALAGSPARWAFGLASLVWRPLVPLSRALSVRLPGGCTADAADLIEARIGQDVLVLDDAQFADAATLAVMTTLGRRIQTVFIVRTGEPLSDALLEKLTATIDLVHVELTPLNCADATELCRTLGADEASATRIAAATGGLPLWCVRSVGGETGPSLISTIAAQLDRLDVAGRTVLCALGLAGRPLLAGVLGAGTERALAAGLVVADGAQLQPVHPLVADIAAARMTSTDRAALHRALGQRLADPGEAARHFIAAGDRTAATGAALRAASAARGVTERAVATDLIAAAAGTADIALAAARWWLASGDPDSARSHLRTALADPTCFVEACAVAAGVARRRGDAAEAAAHLAAGVEAVDESSSRARRLLDIELMIHDGTDPLAAAELAGRCTDTPEQAAAALVAAVVGASCGADDWQAAFRQLRTTADCAVRLEAMHVESAILMLLGRVDEAIAVTSAGADAAGAAGAVGWVNIFRRERCWIRALNGRESLTTSTVGSDLPVAAQALVLSDVGLLLEAAAVAASAPAGRRRDAVQAVLAWAGSDDLTAAAMAGAALRSTVDPVVTMLAGPVASWTAVPWESPIIAEPIIAEVQALTAAPGSAVDAFLTAATLWRAVAPRGSVRCAWAAADEAVRADRPAATELTAAAIDEVERSGIRAFDGRLVATARQAGLGWTARRGAPSHGLTAREAEVLRHVGVGLSSVMIARRLGVSVATVETHVRSAVLKLGTSNRRAAAAKLA